MMIAMTIDVTLDRSPLRTAALSGLTFDALYLTHHLLQGLGPTDTTPAGITAFNATHRTTMLASEVALGLALNHLQGRTPNVWTTTALTAFVRWRRCEPGFGRDG